MRRKLCRTFLSAAIFFGLSMTGFAGSLTLTFTNVAGTNAGGVYTGIYYGTLTSNGGTSGTMDFMCDDYQDEIKFGESWQVSTYNFGNIMAHPGGFGGVTFGANPNTSYDQQHGLSQVEAYALALHIAQSLLNNPTTPDPQASADSYAIWWLLDANMIANLSPNLGQSIYGVLLGADVWWTNFWPICQSNPLYMQACIQSLSDVTINVPVGWANMPSDRPQEFLGTNTMASTPEPVSVILMGSFLSLAGGLMSRKKRVP